ncbi:MAG: glycosyltransferase family 2 protein [Ilumatobacteraceae bacterium]|nr:glycosyltransferase family 2 protein [Ilumatobacteraceae bacterium]
MSTPKNVRSLKWLAVERTKEKTTGCLSVVMPCYNEEATVREILDRVFDSPLVGEVIAVDDASNDATLEILQAYEDPRLRVLSQPTNAGKGAALRRGFAEVSLEYVIIQDADLEYDPAEYDRVLGPLLKGVADVVYGSRFSGGDAQRILYFWHTLGNRALTLASNMATNLNLSDMETCYKAFSREILAQIEVEEDRFGFEPEITAKVAALGCRVYEVGISYHGRTYDEGKKIGWRDGVQAIFCIAAYSPIGRRFRLSRLSPTVGQLTSP